jgi:hypothetical protein
VREEEVVSDHTPGPWAWTSPDILMAPTDRVLLVDGEPTKADARLIAAAPDLRRLLVIAYDALFFERGMTPQERDDMRRVLEVTA